MVFVERRNIRVSISLDSVGGPSLRFSEKGWSLVRNEGLGLYGRVTSIIPKIPDEDIRRLRRTLLGKTIQTRPGGVLLFERSGKHYIFHSDHSDRGEYPVVTAISVYHPFPNIDMSYTRQKVENVFTEQAQTRLSKKYWTSLRRQDHKVPYKGDKTRILKSGDYDHTLNFNTNPVIDKENEAFVDGTGTFLLIRHRRDEYSFFDESGPCFDISVRGLDAEIHDYGTGKLLTLTGFVEFYEASSEDEEGGEFVDEVEDGVNECEDGNESEEEEHVEYESSDEDRPADDYAMLEARMRRLGTSDSSHA